MVTQKHISIVFRQLFPIVIKPTSCVNLDTNGTQACLDGHFDTSYGGHRHACMVTLTPAMGDIGMPAWSL